MRAGVVDRRWRAALLAALVAACLPAAPAQARVRFGVNYLNHFHGPPQLIETQRMRAGGATLMRIQFGWGRIQPRHTGPPQWTVFDATVRTAALADVDILPILLGVPGWVSHDARAWPADKAGLKAYADYVRSVVGRYGRGGVFWREHPEIPYRPLTRFEVWSEQNREDMAPPGNRARLYAKLLAVSRKAIDKRDPRAKIVMGGMTDRSNRVSIRATQFLRQLLRVRKVERTFDAVAIHPYGGSAREPRKIMTHIRRTLDKLGQRKTPLWITEMGWGTGGEGDRNHPLVVDRVAQARRLAISFRELARASRRLRLQRVIWYAWRDILPPGARGTWDSHSGLFTSSGEKKPAWDAYASVNKGQAGGSALFPPPPPPPPESTAETTTPPASP